MPNNLTPEILDALEAAEKKATPGPWKSWADEGATVSICAIDGDSGVYEHRQCVGSTCSPQKSDDAELIARNRNHTPDVVAALRGALRVVEAAVALVDSCSLDSDYAPDKVLMDCVEAFRRDNPGLIPKEKEHEDH